MSIRGNDTEQLLSLLTSIARFFEQSERCGSSKIQRVSSGVRSHTLVGSLKPDEIDAGHTSCAEKVLTRERGPKLRKVRSRLYRECEMKCSFFTVGRYRDLNATQYEKRLNVSPSRKNIERQCNNDR